LFRERVILILRRRYSSIELLTEAKKRGIIGYMAIYDHEGRGVDYRIYRSRNSPNWGCPDLRWINFNDRTAP
jgi:hypothetical protein